MQRLKAKLINKNNGILLLLLCVSTGIFCFYFSHLITHLNSVLFNSEGDSLKNYYTFVYHVKNDDRLLEFTGLNFPYGEHIVYTDCQPLLSIILKVLPFTHPYLIGIMHALILFSFIVTPLILFRIFMILKINKFTAFFSALAIALLSPQIHRLGGHFALAYGCIIPLGILFLLKYLKTTTNKNMVVLFVFNSLLFLVHPYFGLGLSMFCFLSILLNTILNYKINRITLNKSFKMIVIGIAPIVVFKLFMFLTDHHFNRPDEPYGVDIMGAAANAESVFTPSFGPFTHFLKKFITSPHVEWEALSYIGFFSLIFMLATVLMLPFYLMRLKLRSEITAVFIASVLFLCIAFGAHIRLLGLFGIEIATLNQFRAFGRFAWYFYFLLPVFLITQFANFTRSFSFRAQRVILPALAILFFLLNMLEGHYLFGSMTNNTFNARNIFNQTTLSPAENDLIKTIKEKKYQAILPIPVFHIGSEVYQRNGEPSLSPAMFYSYHTALPVLSVMMSRTSLNETESALEILNRYKKQRPILNEISNDPILVMKTGDIQKNDELRLLNQLAKTAQLGAQEFYTASKQNFTMSESERNQFIETDHLNVKHLANTIFIKTATTKPFTQARIDGYETLAELDSGRLRPGNYTVSFHYHLKEKKFRFIHNHLIVVKKNSKEDIWEYFTSVRSTSGFYKDFIVFEEKIKIDDHSSYQFMMHGPMKEQYSVSDFLLKPDSLDILLKDGNLKRYNNYPE